jgi:hypothetical protein|tara:strand:+ start:529 stop:756 length:228 start_codon:yes stop_codon:yes gene_type:complete
MSYVKEPARLATINLRAILDAEDNKPTMPEKQQSGLLTPRKSPMMEMSDQQNETQRVLSYMREIRKAMKVNKDVV